MVPKGWSNKCVEDNISFSGGSQPPRSVFKFKPEDGYIRLIQIRDYKTDKFETYIPRNLARKFCTVDDVMIGRYGPPIFQILRGIEGAYNVALIKATPKAGVEKDFMYYFLTRDALFNIIESHSQRTSGQTGIEMDVLKSYPMPLPPIKEQQKIAKILTTWDKAISTTERLIDNSTQQKKALMQQLLTGKKRLLDDKGKRFEGDWEEALLGECADLTAGGTPSTKKPEYWNGKIPWMNSGDVNLKQVFSVDGRITELGLKESSTKEIPENSVLIALAGQGKTRGTVAINRIRLCTNQSIAAIMPYKNVLNFDFLYFNLDSRYQELRSMSTGDGGRGGLNLSILKSIKLLIPAITEQQKIATVLTNADKEIELLKQQLADLQQEKKALMQVLLTGNKRVVVDS